jgi:hypothetical protein
MVLFKLLNFNFLCLFGSALLRITIFFSGMMLITPHSFRKPEFDRMDM